MVLLQCKLCGGNIELSADKTFGTCDCCGSSVTFPKNHSAERTEMFNRGNYFRRIGEFDKALSVFEQIIKEDYTDAEAHWCCALCRFGIEYVEDPTSHEWIPTCHRVSYDSFLQDIDYVTALEHSDSETKNWYEKEAVKINEIQKRILAESQNVDSYDIFICYKETDENGERTKDSVIGQEIFDRLTEKNYRVFFARISLENKLGVEYEPYIFAALNSAKVMIVVGTSKENLDAVWVKNEWSRFIANMKKDSSKVLIPCYADMNPYEMPDSLARLQSYDVNKIGFIQDLVHGIGKIIRKKDKSQSVNIDDAVNEQLKKISEQQAISRIERGNAQFQIGNYKEAYDYYADGLATLKDHFTAIYRKTLCAFYLAGENPPVNQLEESLKKTAELGTLIPDDERVMERDTDLITYVRAYLDSYSKYYDCFDSENGCHLQADRICNVFRIASTVAMYISNEKNQEDTLLLLINCIDNWMKTRVSYIVTTNKGTGQMAFSLSTQEKESLKQVRKTCVDKYNSMPSRADGEKELLIKANEKEKFLEKLKEELAVLKQRQADSEKTFWEANPELKKTYDQEENKSTKTGCLLFVLTIVGVVLAAVLLKSILIGILFFVVGSVISVINIAKEPSVKAQLPDELVQEIKKKEEEISLVSKEYVNITNSIEQYRKNQYIANI